MVLFTFTLILALLSVIAPSSVDALWPAPKSLSTGSSALRLSSGFNIQLNIKNAPSDLKDAVKRSSQLLKNDKLEMLAVGRGSKNAAAVKSAKQLKTLTLLLNGNAQAKSISDEAVADLTTRKEAYALKVPADGSGATLTADS